MSDTKSASAMFEILGKAMDEVAREFGAVDRDDPKRGPLLEELSGLTQLRLWLKSGPNRLLAQPWTSLHASWLSRCVTVGVYKSSPKLCAGATRCKSTNSEVLSSPNLSRVFVVAQTAKAYKLRPVIRVGIRDRKAVGPRPLRKPFLADGFFVSSAGFKFLEIARPGNPRLAVD